MEVENLARNVHDMGVSIHKTTTVTNIVSCLPEDKFHAFKKAWNSIPDANQTVNMLMASVRKEELTNKTEEDLDNETKSQAFAYAASNKEQSNRNN